MPAISILMPVRDAAPWLPETLASLLGQTRRDWELVAVDDGSRDESAAILQAYAGRDPRIRVVGRDSAGGGIVSALNRGLAAVRAPLLVRMDADDIAHPQRLARQQAALNAYPFLFAVGCRVRAFPASQLRDGMRRYLTWQNSLVEPDEIARDRFVESPVLHPSIMMRTAVLRDTLDGWRERGWPEDWDLLLRAFERGLRIGRVPHELLSWRLHARQATRVDERYSQERFLAARAHFLARWLRRHGHGREAWILGAGPVGKRLGKALAREGARVGGFVDVDPRKIGGGIRDGARSWQVISMPGLYALQPRPLAIAAVGKLGGRDDIRGQLGGAGWQEGSDYLVAA